MDSVKPAAVLNEAEHRFEVRVGAELAVLEYRRAPSSITFTHTGVPENLEGQGIGSTLVCAGLDYAREHQLTVIPVCHFVQTYMRRHKDTLALLDPRFKLQSR
jgi:uncharacterized protein